MKKSIELLAPARNVETGIAAIQHGADAVYIGGPEFGARAAAGNSLDDIERLCHYAHTFQAKVYVTFNTILRDDELDHAARLIHAFYRIGVDALIVQDMALLQMDLPPIALHASTQMDNQTVEKALLLKAAGFQQIVLARETPLARIRTIAEATQVPLEVFVHGALCVSYSGRCYASEHCFKRSANRGACAQFCRLPFDLINQRGEVLVKNKHLLSLRDMNRTASLEEMMDAGVRSFKIEGRLKDSNYVKNVTAWYRKQLDAIIDRRSDEYERASFGHSQCKFIPDVSRSFNRGFTDYFLHGRKTAAPVHAFHSPKAIGPAIGKVSHTSRRSFTYTPATAQTAPIVAGDGLCDLDAQGVLQGFRVNKVEGREVIPATMPPLRTGTVLHRSMDHAFSLELSHATATRTLTATITLREVAEGYALDMADETGAHVTLRFDYAHETARSSQQASIVRQLSKLGDTPFVADRIDIVTNGERFIPASVLTSWRRQLTEALLRNHHTCYVTQRPGQVDHAYLTEHLPQQLDFTANVANHLAKKFYLLHGVSSIEPAFEVERPERPVALMTCRHCIRHALGICLKQHPEGSANDQLSLRSADGQVFPLRFDCQRCEMQVLSAPLAHSK